VSRVISALELQAELKGPNPPLVLDVREPHELGIAKIDEDLHIPMGDIGARLGEIDKSKDWVVICRSGNRSGTVTEYLAGQGYKVRNLQGGLLGWARDVDPSMRTY